MTLRVAVTGAGGYLGGRLVDYLTRSENYDVCALTRRPAPWLGPDAKTLDLTGDTREIERAVEGADAVVHLAGPNEVLATADPDRALTETTVAALHIGEACAASGVKRLVHVSTVHVYGTALEPGAVVTERVVPQPRSLYAISRLATEHLLSAAVPDTVVIRLTNGVGPPAAPDVDRWSLVANDLCRQAVTTEEVRLRSDGLQWRDFVALEDVCAVLRSSIDRARVPADTYNFGSGQPLTVRALAELVADVVDSETGTRPPVRGPEPVSVPTLPYTVSSDRLAELGLRAEVPLRSAIEQTVRFCVAHRDALERSP